MPDYQRIVDDLRNTVLFGGTNRQARLDEILTEYAEACRVTNDRLRQCESMMRKGLRSEAIRLGEIEPNLLDQVAMLDFPEREQVEGALSLMSRDLPRVLATVAADLNEAYAVHLPLQGLLSRHRYLALVGAPLKNRLAGLRKLVELDSFNPSWHEDLAAYETERYREIQVEGNRAVETRDLRKLDELLAEVRSSQWRQAAPSALIPSLEAVAGGLRTTVAAEQLARLEKDLTQAHAAVDFEAAKSLKASWNAALLDYTPPDDDPIWRRVEPALQWLAKETEESCARAYAQAALAKLVSTLAQDDVDRVNLEEIYQAATSRGAIPETVEQSYREKLSAIDRAKKRKLFLSVGLAVAALVLVVVGIRYGLEAQSRNRRIEDAIAAIAPLVRQAEQDPDKAHAAAGLLGELEKNDPETSQATAVRSLATELATVQDRERRRAAAFREAVDRAKALGPAAPEQGALKQARGYARTPEEKAEVARFDAEVSIAARDGQDRMDKAFLAEVEGLKNRVAELDRAGVDDLDRVTSAVRTLRADATALSARYPLAGATVTAEIGPILTRADGIESAAQRGEAERQALRNVYASQADPAAYVAAIAKFVGDYPNSTRAADLKQAGTELSAWTKVEEWNREIDALRVLEANIEKRKDLLARLNAAAGTFAQFPEVGALTARQTQLRDLLGRNDDTGVPLPISLQAPFENKLLADSWVLNTKKGERFYVVGDVTPAIGVTTQRVEYFADYSLTTKVALIEPKDILSSERAPQNELTVALRAELERLRAGGDAYWETGFANLIRIVMKADKVEPVLRLALVKRFVSSAEAGSHAVREGIRPEHEVLENLATNLLVNWMDPRTREAKQASQNALQDLAKLAALVNKLEAAATVAERARNEVPPLVNYRRRGCLSRDVSSEWRCVPMNAAAPPSESVLFVAISATSGPILREVGRSTKTGVAINASDSKLLVDGRPVWSPTAK